MYTIVYGIIVIVGVVLVTYTVGLFIYKVFHVIEMAYVELISKRLFVNHLYVFPKRLEDSQKNILSEKFKFYNNLSPKHQKYFEYRVNNFLKKTEFHGRDIEISEEIQIILAGTATKLLFGLRDYNIGTIEKVVVYAKAFFSRTNKAYHKGEFNYAQASIVFSWIDVVEGYAIDNDNANLAVHEFVHAIHFHYKSVRHKSTSAAIFLDAFAELTELYEGDKIEGLKIKSAGYFREYAFVNEYEFLAVIIECFIETPSEFRAQFPEMYKKVKTMLNYNFVGY
ncbi:MAG: hypothetical protein BM564_05010 [Bacteroidetes bacterium MedPE-SWsnd-G2]|nr:MAG: hypothetical protein BM564_05010 [Bacteroidetes bacterium MedPE-SWsnd-G2]